MALPKMDVPIGVVEWELFVPEQYNAKAIDGNVIDAKRFGGFSAAQFEAVNRAGNNHGDRRDAGRE